MYAAGENIPGTMAAIVGLDDDTVRRICAEISDDASVVVPANFNSPGQIVISGNADRLRQSLDTFKQGGAKMAKELPVSGAFHSPLMKPAQEQLAQAIMATPFSDTTIDVYANVTALPTRSADELRRLLIEQVCAPVLWTQTVLNMADNGINTFVEIGPGKVLQGLVKRTVESEILGYDTEKDIQQLLA